MEKPSKNTGANADECMCVSLGPQLLTWQSLNGMRIICWSLIV
jgi:hypothetical protein